MITPRHDQDLVEEVLLGRKEVFAMLVDKYKDNIYGIFRGMGAIHQDAQDLTQETFIKTYRKLASHNRDRSFASWLYVIAVHTFKDHVKRKSVLLSHEQPEVQERETPESLYLRKETNHELRSLLELIPMDYRLVLLLRYVQELSYEEIADITEMSTMRVKNCLYRAKKSIYKKLGNKEGVPHEMFRPCPDRRTYY